MQIQAFTDRTPELIDELTALWEKSVRATHDFLCEREILEDRRRKAETAMNRLKSLYLYGDEEPSQAEFIIEREKIAKELTEIEARLAELRLFFQMDFCLVKV